MSAQPLASAPKSNTRLDLTGLEELFEQQLEPLLTRGLSVKEAVFFYGTTKKQLKKQIKSSLVPAVKVTRQGRKKWLVYPDGIPQEFEQFSSVSPQVEQPASEPEAAKTQTQPAQSAEEFLQAFTQLPKLKSLTDNTQILDFSPDINDPFVRPTEQNKIGLLSFAPEDVHFSRLIELEQLLAKAQHQNEYLETRIAGLEDQVKFLIQAQYNQPSFNRLAFIFPVLVALSAILAACLPALSGS